MDLAQGRESLIPDDLSTTWKTLARLLSRMRRVSLQVVKASERWDLRQLRPRVTELRTVLAEASESAREAEERLGEWRAGTSAQGVAAYAADLERALRQLKLPLEGEFPDYEVFPLAVRLDLGAETAAIGRRKTSTLEPSALAREVQRQHQAVQSSSLNARRFTQSLVAAHALLKDSGRTNGRAVPLLEIYRVLTLRTGSAGYSKQEFAFDIYRLRRESDLIYEGQRLSFQHAKRGGVPVPNAQGGVEMFGTLEIWEVAGDA